MRLTAKTLAVSERNFRLAEKGQTMNFELNERGHLTERYTKAIEQLGDANLDVRLGGIYALEQLATDSQRDQDQATIVEVLSAFVRGRSQQHRPKQAERNKPDTHPENGITDFFDSMDPERFDVRAAVTVLGRLRLRDSVGRVDLTGAWLSSIHLRDATLSMQHYLESICRMQ